jgi:hypothetical protein
MAAPRTQARLVLTLEVLCRGLAALPDKKPPAHGPWVYPQFLSTPTQSTPTPPWLFLPRRMTSISERQQQQQQQDSKHLRRLFEDVRHMVHRGRSGRLRLAAKLDGRRSGVSQRRRQPAHPSPGPHSRPLPRGTLPRASPAAPCRRR